MLILTFVFDFECYWDNLLPHFTDYLCFLVCVINVRNVMLQVEGLLEEKDFRIPVSRDQFEDLCEDLFLRVKIPIEMALKGAGMTMDLIDQVILVGAGTRIPKVQEKLTEALKRELGKSLNTDEAAAMGAVYKAADLSSGFKVKKFVTKDAVLFPILVNLVFKIL